MAAEPKKSFADLVSEIEADSQRRKAGHSEIFRLRLMQKLMDAFEIERADRRITKADLAKVTGINPVTVRRILSNPEANPRLSTLIELADALDCELTLTPRPSLQKSNANTK